MPTPVKPSSNSPALSTPEVHKGEKLVPPSKAELPRQLLPDEPPQLSQAQGLSPRGTPLPPTVEEAIKRRHAAALEQATGGLVSRDLLRPPLTDAQLNAWKTLAAQGTTIDMVIKVNGGTRSVRLDLNSDHLTHMPEAMHGKHPLHVCGELTGIRIAQPLPPGISAADQERLNYRRHTSQGPLVSSVQTHPEGPTTRVISTAVHNRDSIITFPDFDPSREVPLGLLNRCHIGHESGTPPPSASETITH